jgi:serine protease Do
MLLGALAAAPLLATAPLAAQGRAGGGRIALLDNRLWLDVSIGGRGPWPFIIDTGAFVNLIREDLARSLGLRAIGPLNMGGIGGRTTEMLYRARDVRLGALEAGAMAFAGHGRDLRIHPRAMGALSASLLTFADSDLDFEAMEWRRYPDGREARPDFTPLPGRIQRARPGGGAATLVVDTTIDGQVYRLQVDTGSPAQLHLWSRSARRSGLWDDGRPFAPVRPSGIGGEGARGRLKRIGDVRLGSLVFPRALAVLEDPAADDSHSGDGLIGLPLIQRMNLSTDVRRAALRARPNAVPPPPERYGLSGLWVESERGGVTVVEVSPASPAAEAGLRVGDTVTDVSLDAFVGRLSGRPGDTVEIAYRRGGEGRRTRLTLRAFL